MAYNFSQNIQQQNSWGGSWWKTINSFLLRQLEWYCSHLVYAIGQYQGEKVEGFG
jgi:hypothetical protein